MDETTPLGRQESRTIGGRYTLRRRLGQGGMATVELAYDEQLDREVAIKTLHARYADDPAFLARFRREAQAAASLNHPNVVTVYDTGDFEGRPFIVMEYVPGRSLSEIIKSEAVTPERATEIVGDAALGLHYAHERGLVHRDVKPGNIMISDEGQVKVADFGIARAVGAETVTQTAAVFGTAAYMAPEQAQGREVDPRTDVYALGCVLYELLAGCQPFTAESAIAVANQHVSATPVPPSRVNPDITGELDDVVMKAMAKAPDDRYQTARDLNADLQRALAGLPLAAPPAAAWDAATQVVERRRDDSGPVATAPPVARREEYDDYEDEEDRRRRRRLGWTVLAILLLALLAGLGFVLAALFADSPPAQVQVPDVRGLTVEEAQTTLEAQAFDIRIANERVESADIEEGRVVTTDPEPLALAPEGAEVALTLSAGPPLVEVPELEGLTVDEATAAIRDAGLTPGPQTEEPSDDVEEGLVLSSTPAAGEQVPEGGEVSLVVSSGREAVRVPTVENLPEDDATAALEEACEPQPCFEVNVERATDEVIAEGRVISQDPGGNTDAQPGSQVTIVVSEGAGTVALPNVENLPEGDAVEALEGACEPAPCVEVRRREAFSDQIAEGRVISQDPGPGTDVEPGATVTIVVSLGAEPEPTPTPTPQPTDEPTADPTEPEEDADD